MFYYTFFYPIFSPILYLISSLELEWKVIYVGSAKDPEYDQILDTFSIGPLEYGVLQFDLEVFLFNKV